MGKLCSVVVESYEYCDGFSVGQFVHNSTHYVVLRDIFKVLGLNMRNVYDRRWFTNSVLFSANRPFIAKFAAVPVKSLIEDLKRYRDYQVSCRYDDSDVELLIAWLYRASAAVANKIQRLDDGDRNWGVGMIAHNVSGNMLRELTRDYIQRTYRDTANLMPDQSLFVLSDICHILKLSKTARANGFTVVYASVPTPTGYVSQQLCCTESNLRYYLQYRSRKPEARELLKWLDSRFNAVEPVDDKSTVELLSKSPIAVLSDTTKDCIAELKAIRDRVDSLIVNLGGLV